MDDSRGSCIRTDCCPRTGQAGRNVCNIQNRALMKEAVMRKHFDKFAAAWSAFLVLLLLIPASMFSSQAPDPQDQLKDFQARIQKYDELQKKAASSVPAIPKDVTDPNVIARHQQQMGEAIRALRPGAMPGEIFTPGVRQLIINT